MNDITLRTKFILLTCLVNFLFLILSYQLLKVDKLLFLGSEILILLSIGILIHLFRAFIRPLDLIASGTQTMKDRDFNTKFCTIGQKELDQLIEVYNQMMERLREERIKKEQQHYFLEQLIEASPSSIIILDLDQRITALNPAAETTFGFVQGDIRGKILSEIDHPLARELVQFRNGDSRILRIDGIQAYNCHKAHFIDKGFDHHFILIEELTEEIYAAEKRAYEKVIRMMSHEINNSVGAVNSILDSCIDYAAQIDEAYREDFRTAMQVAMQRNTRLNRFMSNFAEIVRLPLPSRENCDLPGLLRSVHVLMEAQCKRANAEWHWQLAPGKFEVSIDVQQMEQVLVNIIKNALEAMGKGGNIRIITIPETDRKLIIRNDGQPIPPEEKQKLFIPFFSTKRNGQGIGLTLTREILRNHGFRFSLATTDDGNTDFVIWFYK